MALGPFPPRTGPGRVLALSGSLRAASSNTLALEAAAALAPAEIRVGFYRGLGQLPPFNPDLDTEEARPVSIGRWRAEIAAADALLISSPEYAHGVPGALKNGLDWLVSGPEFPALLVAFLNPSPRSTYALASLAETVRTMSAELVAEACVTIALSGRPLTRDQVVADPALAGPLREGMASLARAIERARGEGRRLVSPEHRPSPG
jgi:chromate reductase, NAD(P)H dehydrogenase (quinone)